MTRTQRRTRIKSGLLMATAMIFLITLFVLSLAIGSGGYRTTEAENYERLQYVNVSDGYLSDYLSANDQTRLSYRPTNGVIENAQQFCFVFLGGLTGQFRLGANFKITATQWASKRPYLVEGATIVGKGSDGKKYVIWNDVNCTASGVSDYGGLLGENWGILQDVTYYFTGSITTSSPKNGRLTLGGLIGYNHDKGRIKNCSITCGGSLTGEANTSDITVCVGGMIGLNEGNIEACKDDLGGINCSGVVEAYSDKESGSSAAKHCIVNAGGVIGKMNAGTMINCDVDSSASALGADNTDKWEEDAAEFLGSILDILPWDMPEFATAYNDANHIHPSGGIVGNMDNNASIRNSSIRMRGSAMSYGTAGASNGGSIAGAIVGVLGSGCQAAAGLLNNEISIEGSMSAFWLQSFDLTQSLIDWTVPRNIYVYVGGVVGESLATTVSFKNNFIAINRDEGLVEDATDYEADKYTAYGGLLCGDGLLANIGANNWLCRKPSECNTTKIYRNDTSAGALKRLEIFGDGEVRLKGDIVNAESFTVEAKPICSPFYGWTDAITSNAPDFVTTEIKTLAASDPGIEYAVFIDTDIQSGGELTQLAKDINLIKHEYWSDLGVKLKWLNVELGADILVEKGTPVIEEFYGAFRGNGNTISFAAGSKITHDYEPESEDPNDKAEQQRQTPDYGEIATGLFGIVRAGASISGVNVLFGGAIEAPSGLNYYSIEQYKDGKVDKNASDLLKGSKQREIESGELIKDRNTPYSSFTMPTAFDRDKVYVYFLTGEGYDVNRAMNPGYIEVIPYWCEVVIANNYLGVLAGINEGSISNVNVETTKSAYFSVSGGIAYFGTLCGKNQGDVSECSATLRGRAQVEARYQAHAGGMFGLFYGTSAKAMNGLNVFVSGEIKTNAASEYHLVRVYKYDSAVTRSGECNRDDETLLPDGYTSIAYDYDDAAIDEIVYEFGGKGFKAMETYKVYGGDDSAKQIKEHIGTLAGNIAGVQTTFSNMAAVAGALSTFNTPIYQYDDISEKVQIGSVAGNVEPASGNALPAFSNAWAVMDYEEYKAGANGRRVLGSHALSVKTGVNLVYVQESIAIGNVNVRLPLPVSFTLETREAMTFSGWYDYTNGTRQVVTTGLQGDVFTPQNQVDGNRIYVAEVIPLQLFEEKHMKQLAASTNEGRGYLGVTFTLGGEDVVLSGFTPIGTELHPFLGTFDGNGLTLELESVVAGDLAGLFGCVGEQGTVKNVTVKVTGGIGSNATKAAGAVVAINKGLVGQDLSTGKVVAEILGSITGNRIGGIVGVNRNVIKNAEAHFLYDNDNDYGELYPNSGETSGIYGGGAIGVNETVDATAYAKNIIVYFEGAAMTPHIVCPTGTKTYAIGGLVGRNGSGSVLYSSVTVANDEEVLSERGSAGDKSKYRGYLIGYNESANIDSLWVLYRSAAKTASSDAYAAELGAPVSVYAGGESSAKTNALVLINGDGCEKGNILVRYGRGVVDVSISGTASEKGGEVTFLSKKAPGVDSVDFYDYVADFFSGERVSVAEGNNGYEFSPTVGTAKTEGLTGRVFYAGFCDATISTQADYERVRAYIASDYRLYVEYNIASSFTIDAQNAPYAIGTSADLPFRGAINGNGYIVTFNSDLPMHAFVGVLGDPADERHYSRIDNLRMVVQSGTRIVNQEVGQSSGFLTDANYGTISGVELTLRGYIKNEQGNVGGVTGENHGVISSATVICEFANYLGTDGYGALIGQTVGGVVGVNYGTIGNGKANAIDVSIKNNSTHDAVLYGSAEVGGVVGRNAETGVVGSVNVVVTGVLVGGKTAAVAGDNYGSITDGTVVVDRSATYFGTVAYGMIAANNAGTIGTESADHTPSVKAYSYAAPTFSPALTFTVGDSTVATTPACTTAVAGGIVGVNAADGSVTAVLAELHAPLLATSIAGGLVGSNVGVLSMGDLLTSVGADIVASSSGGVVGENKAGASVSLTFATLRGKVGSAVALPGVPATALAGGFAASDDGSAATTVVTLYSDVYGVGAGLAAGASSATAQATNAWVQVSNRSLTPVCPDGRCDFNAIRVVNETLLAVNVNYDRGYLSFTSMISDVKNWYTDISAWTQDYGILKEGVNGSKLVYTPSVELTGEEYCVCYDNLTIRDLASFRNLATLINSRDYYNNVLFRLGNNITVPSGTILRPIGTEDYPFNGILDGAYHRITLRKGSGISGSEYAGLFGYTASASRIANLILVIEQGATIGSVNSKEIGSLVGRNEGGIENVFVNLSARMTYNSAKRYAGAMIGHQVDNAPVVRNSWISILNGAEPSVGNGASSPNAFGVNYVGVLGNGATEVEFAEEYEIGTAQPILFRCYVPTGIGGNAQQQANGEGYFKRFGGWFSDIKNGVKVTGEDARATVTGLGSFVFDADLAKESREISFRPEGNVEGQQISLSFIKFTIDNEGDFRDFATNVNTYGDQGASFTLLSDITVDMSLCESVGTAESPFTGTFRGDGYKITVTGKAVDRDYAGVFGHVGVGGVVQDLLIDASGATFGDGKALYSGIAVALLFGEIKNVVAEADAATVVYTTQGLASSGGIVGRAGKVVERDGDVVLAEEISYKIDNCWLVLAEGATVTNPVGEDPDLTHPDYYRTNKAVCGVGRSMRIVGTGELRVYKEDDGNGIVFDAVSNGSKFYGFIDNRASSEAEMMPIHDVGNNNEWTVRDGDRDKAGRATSPDMLCVIVNKYISSLADLTEISENVSKGRNYRGIVYALVADIEIGAEWDDPNDDTDALVPFTYTPIGGEVVTSATSGDYTNYIECDFVGGFDGQGHTIRFRQGARVTARYAGLFGRVGADARIRNLVVESDCAIGYDTGVNTTRTLYAGVLAGYAAGGSYENIVVMMNKRTSLYGSVGMGRVFGYLPRAVGDVATNCWAVSYNSRENYELNAAELLYNSAFDPVAFAESGATPNVGSNQGGFSNLMVVAAGEIRLNVPTPSTYYFSYDKSYWYALNDFDGEYETKASGTFRPATDAKRLGYNVSFLKSTIDDLYELYRYAQNINAGYNFYHLTFKLTTDLTIGKEWDDPNDGLDELVPFRYDPIGVRESGLNGTFDGQGHTITLERDARVVGEYAGIFGHISPDGTVTDLRIVVKGTLGRNNYSVEDIADGYQNTLYAGAIAYNEGKVENVIVIADGAATVTRNGVSGIAIAYDGTNLVKNVWALVDVSSFLPTVGRSAAGDTGVNTMKIIGIGTVDATFNDAPNGDRRVRFLSTSAVPVMGWYKSFEKNQQISSAMITGGSLVNGAGGHLLSPTDQFGVTYEVAIIKTSVTSAHDLIAIAGDVNVGGYTFESVTFSLDANVTIPTSESAIGYLSIGTAEHPFRGTFLGSPEYKITVRSGYAVYGVFGYNAGTIRGVNVIVEGVVGEESSTSDRVYGALVAVNRGTIETCFAEIAETGRVVGYTVGGLVGRNLGTVRDSVVVVRGEVRAETSSGNVVSAGGLVGVNEGTVEGTTDYSAWMGSGLLPTEAEPYVIEANLYLFGKVVASADSAADANAGGAIGNHYSGTATSLILYQTATGEVAASSLRESAARAGAFVGYGRASINHSVVFSFGAVTSTSYAGASAGYLDGVTALNTWQVTMGVTPDASGGGSRSVNRLTIKGNGKLKASVDGNHNVMFVNITDTDGSEIDGWYTSANVAVDVNTGNVGDHDNTFLPLAGVQNKTVTVIFVNTEIRTAQDLVDMASSVSGGLSGDDIVFTLMNDVTVDAGVLRSTIGTAEYPFRNVFDGQGHTITLNDGAFPDGDYAALFGYTAADSAIRNLILVARGAIEGDAGGFGTAQSERSALLVAYNEGVIDGVQVRVDAGARIVGRTAAALAATSFGVVSNVNVTVAGEILSSDGNTAIAGGVIGANDGALSGVTLSLSDGAVISATDAATVYAGAVAGENYKSITSAIVTFGGKLSADGKMTSYSGVVTGLNLGYVDRAYVEITETASFDKGVSGGLIGNNVNSVTTSLVKAVGTSFGNREGDNGGADSVIGVSKTIDPSKVNNVWVYSDRVANVSGATYVNAMINEGDRALSCPTAEEVLMGKVAFSADVTADGKHFDLFARVDGGEYAAGSGAACDNVTFQDGKIVYSAYSVQGSEVHVGSVSNVRVCLTQRDVISSGEELYAFSLALSSGQYSFDAMTVTLGADFALSEGYFLPIEIPASVSLDGRQHIVTVGDSLITSGVFGGNEGRIENLGLRLTKAETSAPITANAGTVRNFVVYLENGASVSGGNYFIATNGGTAENLWLVVREATALGQGAAEYSIIRINGVGTLAQGGENGALTFTAMADTEEDMIFVGYTASGTLTYEEVLFDTAGKAQAIYTAEFLSTRLDSDYKLQVLSDVSLLGYTGEGETFSLQADLTASAALFGNEGEPFVGTIDGNGRKLIASGSVHAGLFGTFAGEIKDLVIDLTALAETDVKLFAGEKQVTMTRVVIEEARNLLKIGAPIAANNVWIESENQALKEAFMTTSGYSAYSLLYKNGKATYTFGEKITVTAEDGAEQVFAGYFGEKGAVANVVGREQNYILSPLSGCVVTLNYINRTLSSANDLARLASGVAGGFEFEGVTFDVRDGGFVVAEALPTVGDAAYAFKGNVKGGASSQITFASYGAGDTFVVRPLFDRLYGTLSDLLFVYAEGARFEGDATLIRENAGRMSAVVVRSENESLFADGAGLTLRNSGETIGCWLVTRGEDLAVKEGNMVGVNELRVPYEYYEGTRLSIDLAVGFNKLPQGTKVNFRTSATTGRFVCYYDYAGNVVFPGNYNYATFLYTAPSTSSGVRITVRDVNTVTKEDELVYLGYQCATGANLASGSVITLANDLVVERHLNALNFDDCVFDLAGHSLTLAATADDDAVIFGKRSLPGKIVNGSIFLRKGYYGVAASGTILKNVVLFLEDGAILLPDYAVESVTVVTSDALSLSTESGEYRYLYAPKGASIRAEYDYVTDETNARVRDGEGDWLMDRTFVGADNERYYFGGIEDGATAIEEVARFAPVVIRTAADYEAFARAANLDSTFLARAEITLATDVEVIGTAIPEALCYAGRLLAGGHTVTISGGVYEESYLTVVEGGSIVDLALAFRGATITAEHLISAAGSQSRIALVVYQSDTAKQEESDAVVVNVYGQGDVFVEFGESIRFTAVESGNYALREWRDAEGESLGNDHVYDGAGAASAHFALRYLVTVEFVGASEEILAKNAGDLPRFKGTGIYFADEIEPEHTPISVKIENIGEGFLFRSMSAASAGASVHRSETDAWEFTVDWTVASYEIVLRAEITYIEMMWARANYDATAHGAEDLDDILASAGLIVAERFGSTHVRTTEGLDVYYSYTSLGATPFLVGGAPYHAGTYLVSFEVFSTPATGAKKLCNAYCGLEIEPAVLSFRTLLIKDKIYDGTTAAELVPGSLELDGFYGDDKLYVSLDGLTFAFADANAEQGKLVYVGGEAYLAYDPSREANGEHRYAYLDYTFDPTSIVTKEGGLIRANIERRALRLTVSSIKVEYLDQFDANGDPLPLVFRPERADDSGLIASDEETFDALASALITREDADRYDVGYYRIIVGDSLALSNYNVVLSGNEAYYVVEPSLVKPIFTEDTMTYGDTEHSPAYEMFVGSEEGKSYRALRKGDELYFSHVVYNEGEEMLPGEQRYSFTCLFSAKNVNYTVLSEEYGAVDGVRLPLLAGQNTLKILPKRLTVIADDDRNVKRFGKRTESLSAALKTGQSFVEKDHVLVVTRAKGETVSNEYALSFSVFNGAGEDVSDRYDLVPDREGGYFFRITPVVIRIKPNKTSVVYGTPVGVIKYGASVEGGGITLADLYYAMNGVEKSDAGLSDIGVTIALGYDAQTVLPVGEYDAAFSFSFTSEAAERCIADVTVSNTHNMIVVQKRYLTVTISDIKKTYDGVSDFNESKVKFKTEGIIDADKNTVSVKKKSYRLIGDGVSVGVYKIDGEFEIKSNDPSMANNYFLTVVQGNLTIDPSVIKIGAEVGYFDQNGDFTPASITQAGEEVEHTIYYGDAKATLRFSVESGGAFLSIPADGTEKEQSDYIEKTLRISYNRLNKLLPFYDDGKTTASVLGLIAANNNVEATFLPKISVESVALTIRLLPSVKVIGDSDPEIKYEIIAKDPSDNYRVIEGYQELSEGTFSVTVTADRTQGEALGAYSYENIKVDIVNVYAGESLFDETTETGMMFGDTVMKDVDAASLSIEQQDFMKTLTGKIVIYGGALLLLLAIVILLLIFVPRLRRKRLAKKAAQVSAHELWNEGEAEEPAEETPEGSNVDADEETASGETASEEMSPDASSVQESEPNAETDAASDGSVAPSSSEEPSTDDLFSDENTNGNR